MNGNAGLGSGDLVTRARGSSPEDDLELAELQFHAAELDELQTMFDPGEHPKPPQQREEAVTDREGARVVDVQRDTPRVDDVASFDLSTDDLLDVDL